MKKVYLLGLICVLIAGLIVPCGAEVIPQHQITSYEEYLTFIASTTLPRDFVYYEDICEVGEFFLFEGEQDLSSYRYVFADGVGYQSFRVTRGSLTTYETLSEEQINPNNMKRADHTGTQNGYYCHEEILYTYINGGLAIISWQRPGENLYYEIFGDLSLYDNCIGSTAIGRLMNLDTAREMADQISAPYGWEIQDETTTADGMETEGMTTEHPTDVTTAAPLDETTRSDEQGPTWFDRHANAIWAIVISTSVISVAVTFGILSRKGWRI